MLNKKLLAVVIVVLVALYLYNNLFDNDVTTSNILALERTYNTETKELAKTEQIPVGDKQTKQHYPKSKATLKQTNDIYPLAELVAFPTEEEGLITAEDYCNGYYQLKNDKQIEQFESWTEENIFDMYSKLKPYGYYSPNEIEVLIEQNDHLAMYAQGLNFYWQTNHTSNINRKLRYEGDTEEEYEFKEYDHGMADKAKGMLLDAAIKYPSALGEIKTVIESQIYLHDTRKQKEKSLKLFTELLATFELIDYAMPELKVVTESANESSLSYIARYNSQLTVNNVDEAELELLRDRLVQHWEHERASLNLSPQHYFETPLDNNIISGMNKSIKVLFCDLNANNPHVKFKMQEN